MFFFQLVQVGHPAFGIGFVRNEVQAATLIKRREHILAFPVGMDAEGLCFQVVGFQIGIECTLVALAGGKPVGFPGIGEPDSTILWIHHHTVNVVEIAVDQAGWGTTGPLHRVLGKTVFPAGREIDGLTVPAPGGDIVAIIIECQLGDGATGHGHQVNIGVALQLTGKGQPFAVRGNPGAGLDAVHGGEALSGAAGDGHLPDIPVVAEHNRLAVGADVRL